MIASSSFIKATEKYNTFEENVPAHYFRRAFCVSRPLSAVLTIAVRGFYELYLNGERITRGFLSPYISNPNDYVYYDEYRVALCEGENVIGILLGNGFQNNPGGYVWEFDKADFREAPSFALEVTEGERVLLCTDDTFKTAPSPILSDDYRFGEYYDATCETAGWHQAGFDDSAWRPALAAIPPKGELRPADVAPILLCGERAPVAITPCEDGGYLYDFGVCDAGVCRLCIRGIKGQKIELRYADSLKNGELDLAQIWFPHANYVNWERDKEIVHKDTYVCRGGGTEVYQPTFTYHGFRYVKVTGIGKEQATPSLLTYLVYHTELHERGDFSCSDTVATTLQELTKRSILSNFYHFPTDCPQREKNGWTADAALSCEAALIHFDPERNYREWMRNIRKAQRSDGALPGIIPTTGWGFHWGNGPAWDCVLAWLPYYTYVYRGETAMIEESVSSFLAYLRYLRGRCDERGLLSIGLGDWCHIGGITPKVPLVVTDTITAMDIARKIAVMLDAVGRKQEADHARKEAEAYRRAIRQTLVDTDTMRIEGDCQSGQAMALYYGVFDKAEEDAAFRLLLEMIHACDDHMNVGVLGGRVLFHVLSRFGHSELAYKMITREDFPSYGNWLKRGATTLWEVFLPNSVSSMNHHFWGDVSAWFIKCIAGIQLNPNEHDVNELRIAPSFIDALDHASAYHTAPAGRISVAWKKEADCISLDVELPCDICAFAELEPNFRFEDGTQGKAIKSGVYKVLRITG